MTDVQLFGPLDGDRLGFRTVSGEPDGLDRLLLAVGRLAEGDHGPAHLYEGEEILHVLSGRLRLRVGDKVIDAGPGSVIAVPAGAVHGFDVLEQALLEVVAEQRIGTLYRVRATTAPSDWSRCTEPTCLGVGHPPRAPTGPATRS